MLATDHNGLLRASALLLLWRRGFVEDVVAPVHPRHLAAQQLLALALQEGAFGARTWRDRWGDLALMDDGEDVLTYLRTEGFLTEDSGLLSIGPRAEQEFGSRHFMDLLSSFVADLELRVVAGTKEVGYVSPLALPSPAERENKPLVLGGRGWFIRAVDWEHFTVWVEEVSVRGDVKWSSDAVAYSYEMCQAMREILLGAVPEVRLSKRAPDALARLRTERESEVSTHGMVLRPQGSGGHRLWTWAGLRANATLLAGLGLGTDGADNEWVGLPEEITGEHVGSADTSAVPTPEPDAITGLKFSAALPPALAARTLGERLADPMGAAAVSSTPVTRAHG